MRNTELLIIDDDANLAGLMRDRLEMDSRLKVFTAENAADGLRVIQSNNISAVFLDIQLPGMSGIEVLKSIKKTEPEILVVMITAHGTIDKAVESLKLGAGDFLTKPFELERAISIIENYIEKRNITREKKLLQSNLREFEFAGGKSLATQKLFKLISKAAGVDSTVLITGESGTGKELIARQIYQQSDRSSKPFVKIDCTNLSKDFIGSDLFGHEKGAFTGASQFKRGRLELADGGVAFFDEIGELCVELQAKLLRIIQFGEFERLGGTKTLRTNIRIIAATNRDLVESVKLGKFREDLFYRLNVINIFAPPLRNRLEDISELVDYFVNKYGIELKKEIKGISSSCIKLFQSYSWPGNVRELENLIERAIVFADDELLEPANFPFLRSEASVQTEGLIDLSFKEAVQKFRKHYLVTHLEEAGGIVSGAAKKIGVPRTYLYQLINELNVDVSQFKRKTK